MNWLRLRGSGTIVVLFGCCGLTLFLSTGIAWASGEAGHSMWPDFFYRLLNFTILVAVLVFIFKKLNLKAYFTKRTEAISNTLRDLEEKKQEAEKIYSQIG